MERECETTYRFSLLQLLIHTFLHEDKTQQIAIITHKECWTPLFDADINNKSTNNAGYIYLYNQIDILACTLHQKDKFNFEARCSFCNNRIIIIKLAQMKLGAPSISWCDEKGSKLKVEKRGREFVPL